MKKIMVVAVVLLALVTVQSTYAADWGIDKAHSTVKFKVKHLLTYTWGEFTDYNAEIVYDRDHPMNSTVNVTINVNSIDTGNAKRDEHLLSADFFNAEMYPTMTFVSKQIKSAGKGKLKVTGDLTIAGVSKEIELMVDGPSDPINFMGTTKVGASAAGTINRTEWGLTWNKTLETGGLLVGENVTLIIDAELNKAK